MAFYFNLKKQKKKKIYRGVSDRVAGGRTKRLKSLSAHIHM